MKLPGGQDEQLEKVQEDDESARRGRKLGASFVAFLLVVFFAAKLDLEVFSAVSSGPEIRNFYLHTTAEVQKAAGTGTAALLGFVVAAIGLFLFGCQVGTKKAKVPVVALLLPLTAAGLLLAFAPTPKHGPGPGSGSQEAEKPEPHKKNGNHTPVKGHGSTGGSAGKARTELAKQSQQEEGAGGGSYSARSSSSTSCGCETPCGCEQQYVVPEGSGGGTHEETRSEEVPAPEEVTPEESPEPEEIEPEEESESVEVIEGASESESFHFQSVRTGG